MYLHIWCINTFGDRGLTKTIQKGQIIECTQFHITPRPKLNRFGHTQVSPDPPKRVNALCWKSTARCLCSGYEAAVGYLSNVTQSSSNSVTLVDTVYSIDRKELPVPFLPFHPLPFNSDPSYLFFEICFLFNTDLRIMY